MTSIRVLDTITKLSPDDTYPVVNGEDVSGFTDLKNEVDSNTSKIETNISNIKALTNAVESHELKVADGGDDPWANLDLSQFDHVYSNELDGKLIVKNASSVTIPFVIGDNMYFEVKRGIEIVNTVARPLKNLDYSYDYDTHELKVSFGKQVQEARILIGVYL